MSSQNSNRSAKPAENSIPRILSMLNTLIQGQKSIEESHKTIKENQKIFQNSCENLTAAVAEIKQTLASNRPYSSSSFRGQQQMSSNSVRMYLFIFYPVITNFFCL